MGYAKRIAGIAAVLALTLAGPAHGRAGDRGGRRSRRARGGPGRSDPGGGRPRDAHRGERIARPGPLLHEARPPRGLLGVAQGAPPQEHHASAVPALARHLRPLARTLRRLRGARAAQLRYVFTSVESLALRRRLGATRMPSPSCSSSATPSTGRGCRYPASGDQVSFRGSEILFQYYAGRGPAAPAALDLQEGQPHARRLRAPGGDLRRRGAAPHARRDDGARRAARARFIAWEYLFYFGGGTPPWMSGMAQATGIQALGRAATAAGRAELPRDRTAGARRVRDRAADRRAHPRLPRRGALPAVLVRTAAVHLQRVPAVADRPVRLRPARRRRPRARALPRGRAGGASRRFRSATWATGRSTTTAATSRTATTTSCCASSSRACARAGWARCTATTRAATAATRSIRPSSPARARPARPGRAGRDALQRVEALGGRGEGHKPAASSS